MNYDECISGYMSAPDTGNHDSPVLSLKWNFPIIPSKSWGSLRKQKECKSWKIQVWNSPPLGISHSKQLWFYSSSNESTKGLNKNVNIKEPKREGSRRTSLSLLNNMLLIDSWGRTVIVFICKPTGKPTKLLQAAVTNPWWYKCPAKVNQAPN